MLRATDMFGNSEYDWNTMPKLRARAGISSSEFPSSRMSAASGTSSPAMMRSNVVLPQPDGPRKQMNSPLATSRPTSSTARTPANDFETPRSDRYTSNPLRTGCVSGCDDATRRRRAASIRRASSASALDALLPVVDDAILVLRRRIEVHLVEHGRHVRGQARLQHGLGRGRAGHRRHLRALAIELRRIERQQPVEEHLRVLLVLRRLHQRADFHLVARA